MPKVSIICLLLQYTIVLPPSPVVPEGNHRHPAHHGERAVEQPEYRLQPRLQDQRAGGEGENVGEGERGATPEGNTTAVSVTAAS